MRSDLLDPIKDKTLLRAAIGQVRLLYRLHEAGQDYSRQLSEFNAMVGQHLSRGDVAGAFGSINPETLAEQCVASLQAVPADLTEAEMLELLERVCAAHGTEFQTQYWLEVLKRNTGDEKISDLIYWPGEYFADGDPPRELSPLQILETALAAGRQRRA